MTSPQIIAYYLPQFYEIELNNKVYGKGFTEWTQTAKAKPLFRGHYQPHIPADLGFYNLLMPEVREAQAVMARKYGVDGFCYWHYWFGNGITTMEKPLEAVLESGEPDFPFCLCWANHTWRNPATLETIIEQTYPGLEDSVMHFYNVLPSFKDNRYMKVDGKPIFSIFAPELIPNINVFIEQWNELAKNNGFSGVFFVGISQTPESYNVIKDYDLNLINTVRLKDFLRFEKRNLFIDYLKNKFGVKKELNKYKYNVASQYFVSEDDLNERNAPTIIPGWDHSPRYGKKGLILTDYTPEAFEWHLRHVFDVLAKKQNKLCFIKAWNEWGEGNHLEPDLKYGLAFLETLKKVKEEYM